MAMKTTPSAIVLLTTLLSCGPPTPSAESSGTPLIETQCAAFCERAITCGSEEFAAEWGFTTQAECLDSCLTYTQYMVEYHTLPVCETILGEWWECAGSIEECKDFLSFEDWSFGMPAFYGNSCLDQTVEVFDDCN